MVIAICATNNIRNDFIMNNKKNDIFPERLRKLREMKGWSMTDTQKRLGIPSLSTYSNYEYGDRNPKHEMLVKMANLFDVSIDYLLGNESDVTEKDSIVVEYRTFDSKLNQEVKRWVIENLSDVKEDDFEKLKEMWTIIRK